MTQQYGSPVFPQAVASRPQQGQPALAPMPASGPAQPAAQTQQTQQGQPQLAVPQIGRDPMDIVRPSDALKMDPAFRALAMRDPNSALQMAVKLDNPDPTDVQKYFQAARMAQSPMERQAYLAAASKAAGLSGDVRPGETHFDMLNPQNTHYFASLPQGLVPIDPMNPQAGAVLPANTRQAMYQASAASAAPDRAPAGYRFQRDGSLIPIPGGPADIANNADFSLSPDAINNMAWDAILTGQMPSTGRNKEAIAQRTAIFNKVADIAKEAGVSPQELATQKGKYKALQASMANLQKQTDVMEKSENTFLNNAGIMLSLSDKATRSGLPIFNKAILAAKVKTGDKDAAAFAAARNIVAQEYAKIASSATGAAGTTDTAQHHALELIDTAQTPEQLRAVIDTLKQDVDGQKAASESQLMGIAQRMQQFGNQPHTQAAKPAANVEDAMKKYGG
ncbi:MAG TPA: hypothetical protein VF217_03585 [Rhodanobacteraceae bacterium]